LRTRNNPFKVKDQGRQLLTFGHPWYSEL